MLARFVAIPDGAHLANRDIQAPGEDGLARREHSTAKLQKSRTGAEYRRLEGSVAG